jgi:hypothetical protein
MNDISLSILKNLIESGFTLTITKGDYKYYVTIGDCKNENYDTYCDSNTEKLFRRLELDFLIP